MPVPVSLIGPDVIEDGAFEGQNTSDRDAKLPDQWKVTRTGNDNSVGGLVDAPTVQNPLRSVVRWPGIFDNVVSFNYTTSHSISPGVANIVLNPQSTAPETFGNLVFGDNIRPNITLRDCYLADLEISIDASALIHLTIFDRRWRWLQGYEISGEYNRMDDHGNLVPWSIQSATELAVLCLKKMGEKKYTIAFPPGLVHKRADHYDRLLRAGQRFPLTFANPYVNWDHIPAAVALQNLAAVYGCRVMLDPITDRVAVLPVGYGQKAPLGNASIRSAGAGIKPARLPKRIGILGAPIKFQMRLALEAVAEEYDGYYTRVDEVAYAPIIPVAGGSPESRGWGYSTPPEFVNVQPTDRMEYTESQQFARRSVFRAYRVRENGPVLPPGIGGKASAPVNKIAGFDVNGSTPIRVPGLFDEIVLGPDAGFIGPGSGLDNFGTITRRQQLILTETKVDQVKPEKRRDADIVRDPNRPNAAADGGKLPDFYNGYSRDRPAECFGTYWAGCASVFFDQNDDIIVKRRVHMPFQVIAAEQMVVFENHVYTLLTPDALSPSKRIYSPVDDLFVETGVIVLDERTNAPYRCRYWLDLGGDAPEVWEIREDVITHIRGIYSYDYGDPTKNSEGQPFSNEIYSYSIDDFGDGEKRAKYYLEGLKRLYMNWETQTVTYNGIMQIGPSGSIQQVRWSLGEEITTTAGVNCEFSPAIPPFPQRKMQEAMTPDQTARILNLASYPFSAEKLAGPQRE